LFCKGVDKYKENDCRKGKEKEKMFLFDKKENKEDNCGENKKGVEVKTTHHE
jgi:hypothetical protein